MSWPKLPLDQLGYVSRGRSRHRPRNDPSLYGGPYPFIQTGDVKHANFRITEHTTTYSEAGLAQSRLWPKDTLCITIAANIADTALLGYEACFPDSVIGFIADEEKADARFVKYYFDIIQRELQMVSQGATQDNLSQEKLLSFGIVCPPVEVQRQVAEVLSTYDDLIATNQRRIALLEDAARRLYREWFVHLRFPGHESVPVKDGVPEGWEQKPLGDLAPLNYGKALKSTDRKDGNVPVYGSSGIVGSHNAALIDSGSIIVGRKGNVGSLYFSPVPCYPIDTVYYIAPTQASYRLYLALHQLNFISSDAAVPGLNRTYAHSLPVLQPSNDVAEEFERLVQPVFEQIQQLTEQNAKLAQTRDLLLPKLMSRQLDVSGIALPDEVAA
jgi:type I restriction enzyme, S subunit